MPLPAITYPRKAYDLLRDIVVLGVPFTLARRRRPGADGLVKTSVRGIGSLYARPRTRDLEVLAQVFTDGHYDLDRYPQGDRVHARYEEILAVGRTPLIIDLGANVGATALWYARHYPMARVVAVEPDPGNCEVCRRNTRGNASIDVIEAAAGGRPGFAEIADTDVETWERETRRTDCGDGIRVVTVGEIQSEHPECDLLLVKIDVEGFEDDIFDGDTRWIGDATAVAIEPHDWMHPTRHTSRTFRRAMDQYDFDLLVAGELLIYIAYSG